MEALVRNSTRKAIHRRGSGYSVNRRTPKIKILCAHPLPKSRRLFCPWCLATRLSVRKWSRRELGLQRLTLIQTCQQQITRVPCSLSHWTWNTHSSHHDKAQIQERFRDAMLAGPLPSHNLKMGSTKEIQKRRCPFLANFRLDWANLLRRSSAANFEPCQTLHASSDILILDLVSA